ncbi:MAG: aspartate carbamoyltransferase catalytic subunit, partial [Brevundimonas sp.]|nr:aspartate carbamoyltransferase catalytic subunit [Brevundimonas sp.]
MSQPAALTDLILERLAPFPHSHFLSAGDLNAATTPPLLDLADAFVDFNRQSSKSLDLMRGRTVMNLFFENSTRTSASFEIAAKRLGADVTALSPRTSSTAKGETLIDTAATLNAMKPDVLVVRHGASGAAALLSQKVGCAVVNAGDGRHEHPTQALLDLLSLRRAFGDVGGLTVAICGDIAHSRVARSNVSMLSMMGARVRLIGPPTLVPGDADRWGCEVFHDMREGLKGCDVVMMLRLQLER